MGQYYRLVCLDTGEWIGGAAAGGGDKQMDWGEGWGGFASLFFLLLNRNGPAVPSDIEAPSTFQKELTSRWHGRGIVLAGDYAERGRWGVEGPVVTTEDIERWIARDLARQRDLGGPAYADHRAEERMRAHHVEQNLGRRLNVHHAITYDHGGPWTDITGRCVQLNEWLLGQHPLPEWPSWWVRLPAFHGSYEERYGEPLPRFEPRMNPYDGDDRFTWDRAVFNVTKGEFLDPRGLGIPGTLPGMVTGVGGLNTALAILLADGSDGSGGDYPPIPEAAPWMGRWAGDRLTVDDAAWAGVTQRTDVTEPLRDLVGRYWNRPLTPLPPGDRRQHRND